MKKLINRPEAVVEEMVEGLVAIYPGLQRLPGQTVLVRADAAEVCHQQVALISGGGSGHEPAHAGYVGRGMLSAAVAGDVFTSPTPDAVLAAIRAVAGSPGVLLIIKNYTGDRLNFGLAAELARTEGVPVETVVVADDVALAVSSEHAGRRGLAGTVLVHKVAGAAAEAGQGLAQVAAEARAAAAAVATMGVALSACTVPAAGQPSFSLDDGEVELGLGIHGEPGVRRGPLEPANGLVDNLIGPILANSGLRRGHRAVLLVNNLGGTPTMELAIAARRAVGVLEARGIVLERVYAGTFLTALEMAGLSLSVLRVDEDRLQRLDAPTDAPAWPHTAARPRVPRPPLPSPPKPAADYPTWTPPQTRLGLAVEAAIRSAAGALIQAAPVLTDLDRAVGDGDLGINLARGAQAVLDELSSYLLDDPATALHALGRTLQQALGGTSGPLYAVFFLRAARVLQSGRTTDPHAWAEALRAGCRGIAELGGARLGDRTMLDALVPAAEAFATALTTGRTVGAALRAAAHAAEVGAKATTQMTSRRGRSSYLGPRVLGHPDPGAVAVVVWLGALSPAAEDNWPNAGAEHAT